MLSTSTPLKIIQGTYSLNVDAPHSFTLAVVDDGQLVGVGEEFTLYKESAAVLRCKVTRVEKTSDGTASITGQDVASFWAEQEQVECTRSENAPSTLAECFADVWSGFACEVAQNCYGYGEYSGSVAGFVERVANSFGLHYVWNPIALGCRVLASVVEPGSNPTALPVAQYSKSYDWANAISTIYLQKSVNSPNSVEVTIRNGSRNVEIKTPVYNSIPNEAETPYPRDVFIDPGSAALVKIYSNSNFINYDQPTTITPAYKVEIVEWSDSTASPRWELFLYAENGALLKSFYGVGEYHAYEGSTPAVKAIIARRKATDGTLEYPTYDGVQVKVITYTEQESSAIPWQKACNSGDVGRPDVNVISEPMFPNEDQLDGVRIAKRDSNPNAVNFTAPNFPAVNLLASYAYEATTLPATTITTTFSNVDNTQIGGEW